VKTAFHGCPMLQLEATEEEEEEEEDIVADCYL
jgi:hypothetical protein